METVSKKITSCSFSVLAIPLYVHQEGITGGAKSEREKECFCFLMSLVSLDQGDWKINEEYMVGKLLFDLE